MSREGAEALSQRKGARLAAFVCGYIDAALFSTIDYRFEDGRALDASVTAADLTLEARSTIETQCAAFVRAHGELLDAGELYRMGCCFFWNRNGHGTGFWDEVSLPENSRTSLADAARACGEADVYVGDDGRVWVAP